MNRRSFLAAASGAALIESEAAGAVIPIIDCHIHLFDPRRPQGVPWPEKNNAVLYKPALPDRYHRITGPLGIRGAIVVEASPWLEDNQWVLDIAAKDTIIVGMIGNLEPGKPEFVKHLTRFRANPLFLGIRYGNLWGRDFGAQVQRAGFISDIKLLASAGLTFDTANPTPALLADVLRLTDAVPNLRVVIDHLPQMKVPADAAGRAEYQTALRELGRREYIFVKISEVFQRVDGQVPTDLSFYKAGLDEIYETFGENRVLFGSDWPNSDLWRPYSDVLRLVQQYLLAKGTVPSDKFFWKNSIKAYKWVKREPLQPTA